MDGKWLRGKMLNIMSLNKPIKTTGRYHYTPILAFKIKQTDDIKHQKVVEQLEHGTPAFGPW